MQRQSALTAPSAWRAGMMIKAVIDLHRARKGYAGMAVYRDGMLLFCEGIEPDFVEMIKALFTDAETAFRSTYASAIIMGFTVSAISRGDIMIISRFEGRFVPSPDIISEDAEYSTGEPAARLITREEAKLQARHIIERLLGPD